MRQLTYPEINCFESGRAGIWAQALVIWCFLHCTLEMVMSLMGFHLPASLCQWAPRVFHPTFCLCFPPSSLSCSKSGLSHSRAVNQSVGIFHLPSTVTSQWIGPKGPLGPQSSQQGGAGLHFLRCCSWADLIGHLAEPLHDGGLGGCSPVFRNLGPWEELVK